VLRRILRRSSARQTFSHGATVGFHLSMTYVKPGRLKDAASTLRRVGQRDLKRVDRGLFDAPIKDLES